MKVSFWKFFRIIFVIFSLYLMGDAFYRWDGFNYYATFSEFLPAVALASILWSMTAVLTAALIWLVFRTVVWLCRYAGWEIRIEHLILYSVIFILMGTLGWKFKKLIWSDLQTTLQLKLTVLLSVAIISLFLTGLFRDKAERWLAVVQERIAPLVWIFGVFVMFSLPLTAYYAWFKSADKAVSKESSRFSITDSSRPNIILVTFDALTARNMSLYGYERPTTPFISEWAKDAMVFTGAEANSNFTTSSTASLMTGKRVWTHQTFHIEGPKSVKSQIESLPAVLKSNGYYNIAFIVNPHISVKKLGIDQSFDIAPLAAEFSEPVSLFGWKFGKVDVILSRLFGDKILLYDWLLQEDFILSKIIDMISQDFDKTTVPPERAFNRLLEVIDGDIPVPFFAWVHLFPPHDPYLPPEPFRGMFNSSSEMRTFKSQEEIKSESYKYLFEHKPFPPEMQSSVDLLKTYYDEFVRYCDKQFGDFIEQLRKRDKLKNTVIVLSSDHGESFEHGYFTHGGPYLFEQVTNIPLVIKEPDHTMERIIHEPVEMIDIPPTIIELARIQVPSWIEGRSLVPLMRGGETLPKQLYSMNFETNKSRGQKISSGSIAVWEGDYKLIHYLDKKESQLFNLKQDTAEINNIFKEKPDISQHLLGLIYSNLQQANDKISGSH